MSYLKNLQISDNQFIGLVLIAGFLAILNSEVTIKFLGFIIIGFLIIAYFNKQKGGKK